MPFQSTATNVPMARSELAKLAKRLRATGHDGAADRIGDIIDMHLAIVADEGARIDSGTLRKISALKGRLARETPERVKCPA